VAIVAQTEPATYSAFVDQLRTVADNLEALGQSSWKPRSGTSPPSKPTTKLSTNLYTNPEGSMDWEPSPQINTTKGFVSKGIQQKRRERDACIKCGKIGHFAKECQSGWDPKEPQQQKRELSKKTAKIEKRKIEEQNSDIESEVDSGKE
jgi:hypothetical protein